MGDSTPTMPFGKHPRQLVRDSTWFNSGPPPDLMREHEVTPTDLFFTRNHGAVPQVDPAGYRFTVGGLVERALSLSLDDLRRDYAPRSVQATVSCAGLRRNELVAVKPIPGEVVWEAEPVSTGVWRGISLAAVLGAAKPQSGATHVAFTGLDQIERHGERFGFGGSIPITKALAEETLLAWELNGAPLPPVHGFPLRALVPGYIGARSVKWLTSITLQPEPSANYFQSRAYRLFPPDVDAASVVWEKGRALGESPINSVIWSPEPGQRLVAGKHRVSGWAWTGSGEAIERVEVSPDGGATWQPATLDVSRSPWSWTLWHLDLPLADGDHALTVRAWDAGGNTQPEDPRPLWNFKGYANNAWHRVLVHVTRAGSR
jgi:sulfite oxidase